MMKIFLRIKKFTLLLLIIIMPLYMSGCALIGTAVSAAVAYGLYKVFDKK